MLKKRGIILLMFGLILAGCSDNTGQKTEEEDSQKTIEVKSENEAIKTDENKKDQANSLVKNVDTISALGEGMYKVGVDIPSGEYMLIAENKMGYFSINSSSSSDSILLNDNFDGNYILTIEDGQYVTITRAKMVPMEDAPSFNPVNGVLSDGMYIAGIHFPAGEYKIAATSEEMGYFSINNGSTVSQLNDIIENDNFNGERYITVEEGQYLKIVRASLKVDGKTSESKVSTVAEKTQTVTSTSTVEGNQITMKKNQEDGISYWKGNQEIRTGEDWVTLTTEEKLQIIQLTTERLASSTDVPIPINSSNEEYFLVVDIYLQTEQTEEIKAAIAGAIAADIKRNN